MIIRVLFENQAVLVIDKPAGMVVNRAESVRGTTVQDWAEERIKNYDLSFQDNDEENVIFYQRSGIAHRLDKDTSGCLIIAKNSESLQHLLSQFRERRVKKTYSALVHGRVEPKQGTWKLPISRKTSDRTEFAVDPFGKVAETSYRVKAYFDGYTLMQIFPKTGRTHQIRVHCKHMKHPLVADERYLNLKGLLADKKWCPRQFLHAQEISFSLPETEEAITVQAPLPKDLKAALGHLYAEP